MACASIEAVSSGCMLCQSLAVVMPISPLRQERREHSTPRFDEPTVRYCRRTLLCSVTTHVVRSADPGYLYRTPHPEPGTHVVHSFPSLSPLVSPVGRPVTYSTTQPTQYSQQMVVALVTAGPNVFIGLVLASSSIVAIRGTGPYSYWDPPLAELADLVAPDRGTPQQS